MQESERREFVQYVASVAAFYGKEPSPFTLSVWWDALRQFDFPAIKDALTRHTRNPDGGHFMPMPADIVKLLEGGGADKAMDAWAKVNRGVREVGPWHSVVFDDPIIHAVLADMGGWVHLQQADDKEWPFREREFEARYRAYLTRGRLDAYPALLPGQHAHNNAGTEHVPAPKLLGDPRRAQLVLQGGSANTALPVSEVPRLRSV